MNAEQPKVTPSSRLSKLLDLGEAAQCLWGTDELGELFRHQLRAPLELDCAGIDSKAQTAIQRALRKRPDGTLTFGDLLQDPDPPLDLLKLAKDFAKANRNNRNSSLPQEVSTVLYFSMIAAALERHGQRITGLSDDALKQGMTWGMARSWLDDTTRSLLDRCLKKFVP